MKTVSPTTQFVNSKTTPSKISAPTSDPLAAAATPIFSASDEFAQRAHFAWIRMREITDTVGAVLSDPALYPRYFPDQALNPDLPRNLDTVSTEGTLDHETVRAALQYAAAVGDLEAVDQLSRFFVCFSDLPSPVSAKYSATSIQKVTAEAPTGSCLVTASEVLGDFTRIDSHGNLLFTKAKSVLPQQTVNTIALLRLYAAAVGVKCNIASEQFVYSTLIRDFIGYLNIGTLECILNSTKVPANNYAVGHITHDIERRQDLLTELIKQIKRVYHFDEVSGSALRARHDAECSWVESFVRCLVEGDIAEVIQLSSDLDHNKKISTLLDLMQDASWLSKQTHIIKQWINYNYTATELLCAVQRQDRTPTPRRVANLLADLGLSRIYKLSHEFTSPESQAKIVEQAHSINGFVFNDHTITEQLQAISAGLRIVIGERVDQLEKLGCLGNNSLCCALYPSVGKKEYPAK